ncbi:MAG TPA: tetratricopeptide repeat protein [Acidobacteriaceae bacterium]|nr:tetratricopeptide repeat protein [Acidobacteriaceae bacterium]
MKKIQSAASMSAKLSATICIAICGLVAMPALRAQAAASTAAPDASTSKIHGHAQDPLYQPITDAKVEITSDGKTYLYTFQTDPSGNYTGSGVKPGTYSVELVGPIKGKDGKMTEGIMDYQQNVKFTAGGDTQVDFDMSREEYVSKLPADVQKQIAETRKSNAAAMQANSQIKNVNKLITDAREARKTGNFDQAIALDTQATQGKPDVGLTWYELGDSFLAAKKYPDAATNYQKALSVMATEKTPKPEVLAAANNNLGEALAKSGKTNDAAAAYEAAAKADPTQAARYYLNEAIVLFKVGLGDPAGTAADKAIAADANQPVAYYIKGWSLVQHASVDPKTNRIQLPPGCADAYHKFLSMQSSGPLADDARSILEQAGEKVQTTYKKH